MLEFRATIRIKASPEAVWSVLVDTPSWPEWDPNCEKITGEVVLGSKLKAFTKLAPGRAFPVTVSELEHPTKMVWRGGMPLGLFKGVRIFELEATDDGWTQFSVSEVFSGPMLLMIKRSLPDMTVPFEQFVAGLKSQVESQPDSARPEIQSQKMAHS